MKRAFVAVLVVSAAALVAVAIASADKPTITKFTESSVYTLSPGDTGCSFPIDVNGTDDVVFQEFYDKSGNVVRDVVHDDFVGTESANGVTLSSTEHATITDYPDGTESWTGQPLKLSGPNGTLMLDAGKLVYGPGGSITVLHGPHPYLTGDPSAYCDLFTP